MASTYSDLKIELIGTGEQSGTWGTTTNVNLGTAIEEAIVGRATANFTADADLTLTLTNVNTTQVARNYILNVTSAVSLTTTRNLIVPTIDKPYIIENNTTGGQSIVVKTSAGTGITVPNGKTVMVYANSTNVVNAFNYVTVAQGGTGASDAATARTNLGVSATGADTTYAFRANNLSDLANAATARTNLGLGTIATQGDGDKGDITVSASGATWTIDSGVIDNDNVNASAAIESSKLQFTPLGTGATARTVQSKLLDFVSFKDYGAVGDGVANDTTAIQNAFNSGKPIIDDGGTYRIVGATIQCTHPFKFIGAGQDKTVFQFENMGGFSGLDAFFINVPTTAQYMSGSEMRGFSIDLANSNGKSGIATERDIVNLGGGSFTNLFSIVRPTFNFESISFTGGARAAGGAATLMTYGFKNYFDVGDSDHPTFKNIIVAGNFDGALNPDTEPTLSTKTTTIFKLGGAEDDTYGGAVFIPTVINCNAQYVGNVFEFGRRVSNPRCTACQFGRMGYFLNYTRTWLGTAYAGLSESQFSNLNINVAYGGIILADTDFLDITDVRVTRSDSTFDHAIDWVAFAITNEARQVSLNNVRGYYSNVNYTNQRDVIRMKGVGVLTVNGVFIRQDGTGIFNNGVLIDSCTSFNINNLNCAGDNDVTNAVSITSSSAFTPLKSHIGGIGRGFTNKLAVNSNIQMDNVSCDWFKQYGGFDAAFTTISAGATENLQAKISNQIIRRAFAAGAGAYTYNIVLNNLTASLGDFFKFILQFNSSAGTNPTLNIQTDALATLFTYTGTSTLKRFQVEVAFNGSVWVLLSSEEIL